MGTSKKKSAKAPTQTRRTTRSRGKALGDPTENTQLLEDQLRALGLYAASTLGDGNCLFRALSDQLYGSDTFHQKLRQEVCNWIDEHKERYEPFVDDERGLEVHLQCMRQHGTYGGHLELSAFAHMARRNVKVVQPGLVYVIQWNAGGEVDREDPTTSVSTPAQADEDDAEKLQTRRERKRAEKGRLASLPPLPQSSDDQPLGPVYVAYHIYEHYSSIRNLRGPHSGPPNVHESHASGDSDVPHIAVTPVKKKLPPATRAKSKTEIRRTRTATSRLKETVTAPPTPSQVPLPISRSPSPVPDEPVTDLPIGPIPYPLPPAQTTPDRGYRSPKRTFDESSASSEGLQSTSKRAKSSKPISIISRLNPDFDLDTPSLTMSTPGSPSSMSELSSLSSCESTPPPPEPRHSPPLTKRQRKKVGLPKPRTASVASTRASAGKIKIPGGRYKNAGAPSSKPASYAASETSEEWQKNGTGRLDVRGFRELKI